jgi:hypothetical protein
VLIHFLFQEKSFFRSLMAGPKDDYRYWVYALEQFGIQVPSDVQEDCIHLLDRVSPRYGAHLTRIQVGQLELRDWLMENWDTKVFIRLGDGSVGAVVNGLLKNFEGTHYLSQVDLKDSRIYNVTTWETRANEQRDFCSLAAPKLFNNCEPKIHSSQLWANGNRNLDASRNCSESNAEPETMRLLQSTESAGFSLEDVRI